MTDRELANYFNSPFACILSCMAGALLFFFLLAALADEKGFSVEVFLIGLGISFGLFVLPMLNKIVIRLRKADPKYAGMNRSDRKALKKAESAALRHERITALERDNL